MEETARTRRIMTSAIMFADMPPPAKRLCTAPPGAAPQVAARLAAEGATLVVEGVPAGTEFGVDLHTWSTGERWVGVSLIPPGLHFVSHRAATRGAPAPAPAPRSGRAAFRQILHIMT